MSVPVCDKLRALAAYDPDINTCGIHLDANESFLELPDGLKRRIADRIASLSYNRYPDPLASGVCSAFAKRVGVSASLVTAGNGSDELISILFNCFLSRGDCALITRPDFSMYSIYCSLSEAQPAVLGKRGDLTFDPDEMINLAKESGAKLVIFSNPCNPTGLGISAEEVLRICRGVDALVIVDEAYMDFWDQSVLKYVSELDNLIVLKTCSKIGFAAARLGFAVANPSLTGYLRAAKSPYNVNSLTQIAGEELLSDPDYLDGAVKQITASRDALYSALSALEKKYQKIEVFATHTNFVAVRSKYAAKLHKSLRDGGVSVRLLGGELLRITAGSAEENVQVLSLLERSLAEIV